MNIVLVRQGTKFSPRYVELLTEQAREHAGLSLVTLTDVETPGETRPLRTVLRGWWAKMELFAPWNADLRPCLYFDLDTYILGDIRDIAADSGEFAMLRDFNIPRLGASGMMIIPRETDIYERFSRNPDTTEPGGDGRVIQRTKHRVLQDLYPGIVSYKNTSRDKPRGRIICFHGKPKPHECAGWAGELFDGGGTSPPREVPEDQTAA